MGSKRKRFGGSTSRLASYLINWGCHFLERLVWFIQKPKHFDQKRHRSIDCDGQCKQAPRQGESDSLIGVEHAERVDEGKVSGDRLELGVRDKPVPVVVVVLVHSLQ